MGPPYAYEGPREVGLPYTLEAKNKTKEITLLGARSTVDGGTGKAVFPGPQRDTYEGAYLSGLRHGTGTYTYTSVPAPDADESEEAPPPKGTYAGVWKKGVKNGLGIMNYADGSKYHGSWKHGKREGQGSFFYANGDIYAGEWVAGKKHGVGTYIYTATGSEVVGTWENGVMTEGVFKDKHGGTFKGAFAGDLRPSSTDPAACLLHLQARRSNQLDRCR